MVERTVDDYECPIIHSFRGKRTHNCETMEEGCNREDVRKENQLQGTGDKTKPFVGEKRSIKHR